MGNPRDLRLADRAKELRKDMTKEERKLWYEFLRDYPVHFYRQRIIGSFIVDFYCHIAKLAIEVDGSQHYTEDGLAYDEERTAYLNGLQIKVIRFSNKDVKENFSGVCEEIDFQVRSSMGDFS